MHTSQKFGLVRWPAVAGASVALLLLLLLGLLSFARPLRPSPKAIPTRW